MSQRVGGEVRTKPIIRPLTSLYSGDTFRFWTARQARSHLRTRLVAWELSK